jgi:hypothetical protein
LPCVSLVSTRWSKDMTFARLRRGPRIG